MTTAALLRQKSQAQLAGGGFAEIKTKYGLIRGLWGDGLSTFKSVPSAGPVCGANRFKAPRRLQPWTGVRDAIHPGPPALQPARKSTRGQEPAPDEDCLFPNIWPTAADRRPRPVMVYSHGGGFTTGSGGSAYPDASNLARSWDVAAVATNHRLGLMGYL